MKKIHISLLASLASTLLLTGCLIVADKSGPHPTAGQRLLDLKRAKDAGALTDAEYEQQKAKLLNEK
jgi:hypothetical protein